jgi:hypothetical protein
MGKSKKKGFSTVEKDLYKEVGKINREFDKLGKTPS